MNEKWNKKYVQSLLPLFGNKPSSIFELSPAVHTKELGPCLFAKDGEGRNSRYMATSDIEVTAIDFSEIATSKALDADNKLGFKSHEWLQKRRNSMLAIRNLNASRFSFM